MFSIRFPWRNAFRWRLSHLLARHWSRTIFVSITVGLLSGLAARCLESLIDVGITHLIGRIAQTASVRSLEFHFGILLLPMVGGLFSGLVVALLCRPTRAHGTAVLIDAFH